MNVPTDSLNLFMKTFLICLLSALWAMVLLRPNRFDYLDFTGDQFDISWDDITEDLWP